MFHLENAAFRKTIKFALFRVTQEKTSADCAEEAMQKRSAGNCFGFFIRALLYFMDAIQNMHRILIGKISGQSSGAVLVQKHISKEQPWEP
jgi:hypothetical protein